MVSRFAVVDRHKPLIRSGPPSPFPPRAYLGPIYVGLKCKADVGELYRHVDLTRDAEIDELANDTQQEMSALRLACLSLPHTSTWAMLSPGWGCLLAYPVS